jgi:hypothetical protein
LAVLAVAPAMVVVVVVAMDSAEVATARAQEQAEIKALLVRRVLRAKMGWSSSSERIHEEVLVGSPTLSVPQHDPGIDVGGIDRPV